MSLFTWLLFTGVHVRCAVCAVSLFTWLLFSGVPARCVVLHVPCPGPLRSCAPMCELGVLCVRCPWPLSSCSTLCRLGVVRCVCGVPVHLAPPHRCARSVCPVCGTFGHWALVQRLSPLRVLCVWCPWPLRSLFTGVPAQCVVLGVRCPWPLGSCVPVCPRAVL